MWKSFCACCLALLLAASAWGQGAPPVQLDPERDELLLDGHLEWLEDASGRMSLAEVQAAKDWALLPGMPNAGFTRSAIWLRLTLVQSAQSRDGWRLSIDDTLLNEVQLHTQAANGRWEMQRAGHGVERAAWPMRSRIPAFRLQPPPGQQVLYLRLQSSHTLSHAVRLHTTNGYMWQNGLDALSYGAYFGVFAVVIMLQLALWAAGREAVSGWYLLFTSVLLSVTLLRSGYLQMALEWSGPFSMQLLVLIAVLAPMAVVRLSAVWLQLHEHLPRFNVIYQSATYVMGLLAAGLTLMNKPALGLQISQVINFLMLLISLGVAYCLWRRRLGEAGYYLVVFGAVDAGILIRMLRNLGLLPVNFFTDYAIYIGTMVHLVLMSLYSVRRYYKLRAALEAERRAREEQKEFVGMVSHEFRTPLAIINTSIQQLAANLDAPAERSLQRAHNIRSAVQRMNLLLDDYLSLDRMDSAQQAVQPRPCDFYEVIEDAASDWPVGRVRIGLQNLPSPFVCDPDLMRIVLRNLLANAVRHSPEATVIDLEARGGADGSLTIRVQDRGEGIPPDELPRMFQRYFRGRASQGKPGAGLGLHLVQRIVQGHGGTIEVQSEPGQGSTFTITLPPGKVAA